MLIYADLCRSMWIKQPLISHRLAKIRIDQQRSLLIRIGINNANLIFIDPYRTALIIDPTSHYITLLNGPQGCQMKLLCAN